MFENPVALWIFVGIVLMVIVIPVIALVWSLRYVIRPGYMRVTFVGEDKRVASTIIKADLSDHDFEIEMFGKIFKYGLERNRIYRSGRFRLPTAYYTIGNAVPIDMLQTEDSESAIAALDYAQVARNTVTRDLLAAFDTSFLSPQNILIITVIVIAVGILGLGVFSNNKFEQLNKRIIEIQQQPIVTPNNDPTFGDPGDDVDPLEDLG